MPGYHLNKCKAPIRRRPRSLCSHPVWFRDGQRNLDINEAVLGKKNFPPKIDQPEYQRLALP